MSRCSMNFVFTQIDLCIRMQKNPIQRLLSHHHFKKRFFGADIKGARKLETRFCVLQLEQFFQQIFSLEGKWGIPMDLSCVQYFSVSCALQLFHFGSVSLRSLSRKMTGRVEHSIAMATFNLEQRVQM